MKPRFWFAPVLALFLFSWAAYATGAMGTPEDCIKLLREGSFEGGARSYVPVLQRGGTYNIKGSWFQYLGEKEGVAYWLYPHFGGVHEIFLDGVVHPILGVRHGGMWQGHLGSEFHPGTGKFKDMFSSAVLIETLLSKESNEEKKNSAARVLFHVINDLPESEVPYHIGHFKKEIETRVLPADRLLAAETLSQLKGLFSFEGAGVLQVPLDAPHADERADSYLSYYRRMVSDGYLDIALVFGDLRDREGAEQALVRRRELEMAVTELGFTSAPFNNGWERQIQVFGQPIRVRLKITSGHKYEDAKTSPGEPILRNVSNFVEALGQTDVLIYDGHTHSGSGSIYLSDDYEKAVFSRFQIGGKDLSDVQKKCNRLGFQPYQLIWFETCSSYAWYCSPLQKFLKEKMTDRSGEVGWIGSTAPVYFNEAEKRIKQFLKNILELKRPSEIRVDLEAARTEKDSGYFNLRGVLHPSPQFVVPEGVQITDFQEVLLNGYYRTEGVGSDGKKYISSNLFVQDYPGQIIQVVSTPNRVYGLSDQGWVSVVSNAFQGTQNTSSFSSNRTERYEFFTVVKNGDSRTYYAITTTGVLMYLDETGGEVTLSIRQAPKGERLKEVGLDDGGRFVARTESGRFYVWNAESKSYSLIENLEPSRKPNRNSEALPTTYPSLRHGALLVSPIQKPEAPRAGWWGISSR